MNLGKQETVTVAFVVGVALTLLVTKFFSGPSNYDDCVLDALKGNQASNDAAAVILGACRRKFPKEDQPQNVDRELDPLGLALLTGRAGLEYGNNYAGDLYNGTRNFTITEVEIRVTAAAGRDTASREYRTGVLVPPLGTGHFSFTIILGEPGSTYSWAITGARGHSLRVASSSPPPSPRYEPPPRTRLQDSAAAALLAQTRSCTTTRGQHGMQRPELQWTNEPNPADRRPWIVFYDSCEAVRRK